MPSIAGVLRNEYCRGPSGRGISSEKRDIEVGEYHENLKRIRNGLCGTFKMSSDMPPLFAAKPPFLNYCYEDLVEVISPRETACPIVCLSHQYTFLDEMGCKLTGNCILSYVELKDRSTYQSFGLHSRPA